MNATTLGQPGVIRLSLTEMGKGAKPWVAELHPEHLSLADAPDAQPFVVLRPEMMKTAILIEGMNTLALSKPCKATLRLQPGDTRILAEWIGLPVLARFYLRRRYGWVFPVAIIWMLGALPLQGDPTAGIAAQPFDFVALILGITLLVAWCFAKWKPHPVLFLVDSLWFLGMGAHLVKSVMDGRSPGWLVLGAAFLWFVWTGIKHFLRFRQVRIP